MDGDNILVIDDDSNNMRQISEILRNEGYAVYSATTKLEALETALAVRPSLVLVKSMLIDSSGYEVIRDLRSEESLKGLPFIMLSEIEKKYDDRYRTIYKIVDTIKLPVDKDDLLQKVSEHIEWSAPDDEQPSDSEDYAVEDEQHENIRFDLIEKANGHSDEPHHEQPEGPSDAYQADSPEPPPHTHSDTDYDDHEDSFVEPVGEETTVMESDEDEILNVLKENRAKRKKLFAITTLAVFAILLAVVYLFFLRATKPSPDMMAKSKQVAKKAPASMPPLASNLLPKPQPAPVSSPAAPAVTPVAPAPTPEAAPVKPTQFTPTPEPVATPAPTPIAQTQKPAPPRDIVPAQEKKQPIVEPPTRPVEKPVAEPVAKITPKAEPPATAPKGKLSTASNKKGRTAKKGRLLTAKRGDNAPASGAYAVQLGSFKDMANAKKLTETLRREGYGASIMTVKDPHGTALYKVLAGRYKNKADAMATMKKLRDTKRMDVILRKS
ncbi:SPOR domain-containing protein [Candidatus Magnetominusculus dajiuhuensis]|uniref:SPOR domain-containing protein n=1 Tax=Candidatus Magnetominusculus dajiuhuensis TaxID=3137712 RepID=UPI003B4293E8